MLKIEGCGKRTTYFNWLADERNASNLELEVKLVVSPLKHDYLTCGDTRSLSPRGTWFCSSCYTEEHAKLVQEGYIW